MRDQQCALTVQQNCTYIVVTFNILGQGVLHCSGVADWVGELHTAHHLDRYPSSANATTITRCQSRAMRKVQVERS